MKQFIIMFIIGLVFAACSSNQDEPVMAEEQNETQSI